MSMRVQCRSQRAINLTNYKIETYILNSKYKISYVSKCNNGREESSSEYRISVDICTSLKNVEFSTSLTVQFTNGLIVYLTKDVIGYLNLMFAEDDSKTDESQRTKFCI